jgi:hypothetical protein
MKKHLLSIIISLIGILIIYIILLDENQNFDIYNNFVIFIPIICVLFYDLKEVYGYLKKDNKTFNI